MLAIVVEYLVRLCRYLWAMTELGKFFVGTFDEWSGRSRPPRLYCTGDLHCSECIGCKVPSLSYYDHTFADVGCIACRFGVAWACRLVSHEASAGRYPASFCPFHA